MRNIYIRILKRKKAKILSAKSANNAKIYDKVNITFIKNKLNFIKKKYNNVKIKKVIFFKNCERKNDKNDI